MRTTRGFTLVETLVAIAILMIAIVIPFYGIQEAVQAAAVSRDQLVASALAQEAIEYAYYVRDSNYEYFSLQGQYPGGGAWTSPLATNCPFPNGCTVDPSQNVTATCSSSGCSPLYINSSSLYTQTATGNTKTRFTRKLTLEIINDNERRATVTVSWSTEHGAYSVVVTENLYNWL